MAYLTQLPVPLTTLVGREQDTEAIAQLMLRPEVRLLTLTGLPGVGKTRLCLQVANRIVTHFPDGAFFISLAATQDPNLVPHAIAQAIGLQAFGDLTPWEALNAALKDQHCVLLLDNFEQLVSAAKSIAVLLTAAPSVKVIVTSRVALRLSGEYELSVPPLELPAKKEFNDPQQLMQSSSVALFVARAKAIQPSFALTPTNAAAVAQICYELGGLPLAIELAAARSKLLNPQTLLARLTQHQARLATLAYASRDMPERHQTLQNALAWSYALLMPNAQRLLRQLSIFAGSFSLAAAEAICGPQALDGLEGLIDHSLLQRSETESGDIRLSMLTIIHEFAQQLLHAQHEENDLGARHAQYFFQQADFNEADLLWQKPQATLAYLQAEHDNLRGAIQFCLQHRPDLLVGWPAIPLGHFWWHRGYVQEGLRWFTEVANALRQLRQSEPYAGDRTPLTHRLADTLYYLSVLYSWRDIEQSNAMASEALVLYQEIDDQQGVEWVYRQWGVNASVSSNLAQAQTYLQESLNISLRINDRRGISSGMGLLATVATGLGDHARVRQLIQDMLVIAREQGDPEAIAGGLQILGVIFLLEGRWNSAQPYFEEARQVSARHGHNTEHAIELWALALINARTGQMSQAIQYLRESLTWGHASNSHWGQSICFELFTEIALALRCNDAAKWFWWMAQSTRRPTLSLSPPLGKMVQLVQVGLQAHFEKNEAGPLPNLSFDSALAALENTIQETSKPTVVAEAAPPQLPTVEPLTPRELEVLRLMARGLTYGQIAEKLFLSPRTVESHLRTVYGKLGVRTRHEATLIALQHGIS